MNFIFFNETGNLRSGWRAAVFLFAFIFAVILLGMITRNVFVEMQIEADPKAGTFLVINALISLFPAILIGWLCGKLFENLPFKAIGTAFTKGWLKHLFFGLMIGAVTLSTAVLIAFIFGGLRFEFNFAEQNAILRSLAVSFLVFAAASAFEEALFRGYILQTFAREGFAWLAIALTSLFFGAVHLNNPDAGFISTVNTILAGVWFGVAYLKTRDLWFVWGLHLMWNWMQGSFFGIEVSGLKEITATPLFREIDSGPSWLTGTTYGVEGGIVCSAAIITSTAVIWFLPNLKPDKNLLEMTSPKADQTLI